MSISTLSEHGGALERIILDRPKANLLDLAMVRAIREHLQSLRGRDILRLIVFEGRGDHFCFGASVAEHFPDHVGEMLPEFHELFREIEALGVPTAAAVRGQCLGGGFELAMWCGHVVCTPTARFGVPEVVLGVFPPIAAMALRWRMSGARATTMVLTGDTLDGSAAVDLGIADACSDQPDIGVQTWFEEYLAPRSAVALRQAWRAVRRPMATGLAVELPVLERQYLEDLMKHRDPVEGLVAFTERRAPVWVHR